MASRPPTVIFSTQSFPSCEPRESSTDTHRLLLRLSTFGFSKLSVTDQLEQTAEIRKRVVETFPMEQLSEENDEDFRMRTFIELFKILPSTYKKLFVSKVIKKFKHERQFGELISLFKQLDASDQQIVIETVAPEMKVQIHGEVDEDFRLRRFAQLSKDYTDHVYKCLVDQKYIGSGNDDIALDKLQSWFSDFFTDFSTIWFQEQSLNVQKKLIQQLDVDALITKRVEDESEEDFYLRSFKDLFVEKAVEYQHQVYFLDTVEERLLELKIDLPHGKLLPPQDFNSAAELLSNLSTFTFSLLVEKDQRDTIEEIEVKLYGHATNDQSQPATEENEEHFRMTRFRELLSKLPMDCRIEFLEQRTKKYFRERGLCEAILLFMHLGSQEQTELIPTLFDRMIRMHHWQRTDIMPEKLMGESEHDFRLRRFTTMYMAEHSSSYLWGWLWRDAANKLGREATLQLHTSENNEVREIQQSQYAEFYQGISLIWFKARCANHPRNPVHVILSSELFEEDDASEKLMDESVEDFRLRRFSESFLQLQSAARERIITYIKLSLFHDLGLKPLTTDTMFKIDMERRGLM